MKSLFAALTAFAVMTSAVRAETFRPNVLDPSYNHDRSGNE